MKLEAIDLRALLSELDQTIVANPLGPVEFEADQEGGSFVLFTAGGQIYGTSVDLVSAVLRTPASSSLPRAPEWLHGVFYWDGAVVPLLSKTVLRGDSRLGKQSAELSDDEGGDDELALDPKRCLILSSGDISLGLQVDEVLGVRQLVPLAGDRFGPAAREVKEGETNLSEALRWAIADPTSESQNGDGKPAKSSASAGLRKPPEDFRSLHLEDDSSDLDTAEVEMDSLVAGGGENEGRDEPSSRNAESPPDGASVSDAGTTLEAGSEIRVLSVVGLLASEEITQFANRGVLESALAGGSRAQPYGADARSASSESNSRSSFYDPGSA